MPVVKNCPQCKTDFSVPPSKVNKYTFCSFKCRLENTPRRTCKVCGKEFPIKKSKIDNGRGSYCSKECWSIRGGRHKILCHICGKEQFVTSSQKRQKYCSKECYAKGKLLDDPSHKCQNCGKKYIDRKRRRRKYCSQKCFGEATSEKIEFTCPTCGKTVIFAPWQIGCRRHCSKECQIKSSERTDIEIMVSEMIRSLRYKFVEQHKINRYVCDFYVINHNLIIEADGIYWHSLPGAKERDQRKTAFLENKGLKVLRLPGEKIRYDKAWCLQQIKNAIKSNGPFRQLSFFD